MGASFTPELLVADLGLVCDPVENLDADREHERGKIEPPEALFGGADDLLRRAACAIGDAGAGDSGGDSEDPAEQEIRALAQFGRESGLIVPAEAVWRFFEEERNCFKPGLEHKVAVLRDEGRVIKDYDSRSFDAETGEVFFKPAELVFDYLTDHLLANHFFGDDIQLKGFYEAGKALHVVITQPLVQGKHPTWSRLVEQLGLQGMEQESPGSGRANFWIDGGPAGRVLVTDVHEDNVIIGHAQMAYPIDVHFKFASRAARLEALKSLGLL